MTKRKIKLISNIIFWSTTAFAMITLGIVAKEYLAVMGTGACPIAKHNQLIYVSLGLLLASMVITGILDGKAKKIPDTTKEQDIFDKTINARAEESQENSDLEDEK